jgi:nucleoside phosphorylase
MEAGGVAVGSFLQAKPVSFFMIRAVSDLADENESSEEVSNWRPYACAAAAAYTVSLLKNGPVLCS